jgi:hypothetical protein
MSTPIITHPAPYIQKMELQATKHRCTNAFLTIPIPNHFYNVDFQHWLNLVSKMHDLAPSILENDSNFKMIIVGVGNIQYKETIGKIVVFLWFATALSRQQFKQHLDRFINNEQIPIHASASESVEVFSFHPLPRKTRASQLVESTLCCPKTARKFVAPPKAKAQINVVHDPLQVETDKNGGTTTIDFAFHDHISQKEKDLLVSLLEDPIHHGIIIIKGFLNDDFMNLNPSDVVSNLFESTPCPTCRVFRRENSSQAFRRTPDSICMTVGQHTEYLAKYNHVHDLALKRGLGLDDLPESDCTMSINTYHLGTDFVMESDHSILVDVRYTAYYLMDLLITDSPYFYQLMKNACKLPEILPCGDWELHKFLTPQIVPKLGPTMMKGVGWLFSPFHLDAYGVLGTFWFVLNVIFIFFFISPILLSV